VTKDGGPRMTLGEHLDELRTRVIRCLLAVAIGAGLAFWRVKDVVAFLQVPVEPALRKYHGTTFIQTSVGEGFTAAMMVAVFAGVALAGPYILYQVWGFVAAGLYAHERRSVKFYAIPGFLLFFCGAAMAYAWVMPWALDFLIGFSAETMDIESQLRIGPFLSVVAWMMLVFGLVFQLPLIMVFLMRLGVVEPATFRRHRKIAIVLAFVIGALLTPPDVISQCIMSGTLIALYEGAILVGARVNQRREAEA
jgi:sec-independent protein translocase protein TatC